MCFLCWLTLSSINMALLPTHRYFTNQQYRGATADIIPTLLLRFSSVKDFWKDYSSSKAQSEYSTMQTMAALQIIHSSDTLKITSNFSHYGLKNQLKNLITKRVINDVHKQARKSLLHNINHWQSVSVMDLILLPYAARYIAFLWNILQSQGVDGPDLKSLDISMLAINYFTWSHFQLHFVHCAKLLGVMLSNTVTVLFCMYFQKYMIHGPPS